MSEVIDAEVVDCTLAPPQPRFTKGELVVWTENNRPVGRVLRWAPRQEGGKGVSGMDWDLYEVELEGFIKKVRWVHGYQLNPIKQL